MLIESHVQNCTFYAHVRVACELSNAIMLVGVVGCCTLYATNTSNWAVDGDQ